VVAIVPVEVVRVKEPFTGDKGVARVEHIKLVGLTNWAVVGLVNGTQLQVYTVELENPIPSMKILIPIALVGKAVG
jgi:hypothetical protein